MITWARCVVLVLIGASIGLAVWHISSSRAVEAERQQQSAIDDYRTALSRFVNGDIVVMQIDDMKSARKRLGNLVPSVFVDARPWIDDTARHSAVVIRDYTEGREQQLAFYAQRGIELSGTGDYQAIARFVQELSELSVSECSQPVCEFPLHLLREASIEPAPSGDTLTFRFALYGYRYIGGEFARARPRVESLADASPDEEATRIISELKSRKASPLEPLPLIDWPQPGPVRTYSGDPFRLAHD